METANVIIEQKNKHSKNLSRKWASPSQEELKPPTFQSQPPHNAKHGQTEQQQQNWEKNKERCRILKKSRQKEEREVEAVQIPARQRPMTPQSTTASPYGIAQTEYCLSKLDRFTKNGIKTKSWEKLR